MSTVVYYSTHNMPVEDLPSKQHTLPSLSQIMPPVQGQPQAGPGQYTHENTNSPNPNNGSPSLNYNSGYQQQQQHPQLPPQPTPDSYSQGSSSTNQSTPASSTYSGYGQPQPQPTADGSIIGTIPRDKCICKSNANRIPRPRNAFILFRQKYHQTVLDEGSVIRTNPEVSRELGRRWRALSPEEKEHWNNLAEEEKKNHAAKYPGYRYTPRRNGKNKNCIVCREKALRQQQHQQAQQVKQAQLVQMQNQQIIQMHQDQYQQYMHLQQQQQMQQQQSQQHQLPLNGYQQQSYIISSNPYQPGLMSTSSSTALPLPQQTGQIPQTQPPPPTHSVSSNGQLQYYDSEKLSPLSAQAQQQQQPTAGQPQSQTQTIVGTNGGNYSALPPATSTSANGILQHPAGSGSEYISSYDQHQRYVPNHHHQPGAPTGSGPSYPFDAFAIQQPPQ